LGAARVALQATPHSLFMYEYNLEWKFITDWRAWVVVGRKQIPFHGPLFFVVVELVGLATYIMQIVASNDAFPF
jgi:hypothetical protein